MAGNATEKRNYRATIFLKSRKSEFHRNQMINKIKRSVETDNIKVDRVIWDGRAGMDIDREEIDLLVRFIEKGKTNLLIINKMNDLSVCPADRVLFLEMCEKKSVTVLVFSEKKIIHINGEDEDFPYDYDEDFDEGYREELDA